MENKKTPEQWFQKLKEPYRSEAIANIDKEYTFFKDYPESLEDALENSFNFLYHDRDWNKVYDSIRAGETTYLEPETLKPEQMESGKWYVILIDDKNWIIKFDRYDEVSIFHERCVNKESKFYDKNSALCTIDIIQSIRPATKEEVLKYFPDEVFENVSLINEVNNSQVTEQQNEKWSEKIDEIIETHVVQKLKPEPIELRPEDLVSGEVYTATDDVCKRIFKFDYCGDFIYYTKMLNYNSKVIDGGGLTKNFKLFHSTPEEKALLLGEEQTELEKVKKLLEESNRLYALKEIEFTKLQEKYNELKVKYDDLKQAATESNIELNEKIRELETKNNQEKVYIAMNNMLQYSIGELDIVKSLAREGATIYEAVRIGKKKSVLVSE